MQNKFATYTLSAVCKSAIVTLIIHDEFMPEGMRSGLQLRYTGAADPAPAVG